MKIGKIPYCEGNVKLCVLIEKSVLYAQSWHDMYVPDENLGMDN